jgi:hypothetical protein
MRVISFWHVALCDAFKAMSHCSAFFARVSDLFPAPADLLLIVDCCLLRPFSGFWAGVLEAKLPFSK